MSSTDTQREWESYRESELARAAEILTARGFTLDERQVHTGGERYLMTRNRDIGGGGRKLVLTGTHTPSNTRVVIKVSSDPAGKAEIAREYAARESINAIEFAHSFFHTPATLLHEEDATGLLISASEFIEQSAPLLERTLEEQFFIALRSLEAQEGVHATTHTHASHISASFGITSASAYLDSFEQFRARANAANPNDAKMKDALAKASLMFTTHRTTVERYCGFLTHADFVPNNFRVRGSDVYLIDHASLHFGNKYESWARLANFMVHHNPALERALADFVRTNRSEDEYLDFRLMRIYKLTFLLAFWTESLVEAEGMLAELIRERVTLWTAALEAVLEDTFLTQEIVDRYLALQQSLRSEEEKERQRAMIGRA